MKIVILPLHEERKRKDKKTEGKDFLKLPGSIQ